MSRSEVCGSGAGSRANVRRVLLSGALAGSMMLSIVATPLFGQQGGFYNGVRQGSQGLYNDQYDRQYGQLHHRGDEQYQQQQDYRNQQQQQDYRNQQQQQENRNRQQNDRYQQGNRYPQDDRYRQQQGGIGPGKGALIGGAGGAVLGALFGGGLKGALIGGGAGAGIGAVAGKVHQNSQRNNQRNQDYRDYNNGRNYPR